MTTKEKYELIDKTKVSAKVLEILEKMEKASSNFTNAEVNSRVDTALDKIIEGLKVSKPEALLSVSDAKKEVKKEKKEAEEKNKGKDLSKKKDTDDKTGLPKKDTVEERKDIIKKESESEKEARERAKKELEKENEKAKDVIESQIEKLNRIILEDPALRGFNTGTSATGGGKSTPLIDAERKAIPRGRRVSQKGRKNQYGASAGGRVYWENRENRSDRKSPDYPTGKPYLEKGGNVYASDDLYEVKMVQDGIELDSKLIRARNKGEARMIFEDMYQEKYQDEFGAFDLEIDIAKDRMADGGGIPYKPYGKTKGRFTLKYEDDGVQQSEIWSSLEEATNSARRYVNPKLGYTNVQIYDESGKEYFFADGGSMLKSGYVAYPSGDEGDELGVFNDKESMINFAFANKDKYGKLIFEGIENDDILEVKKGDSKDVITWEFSRIGMDRKEANKKIKMWFISNYPADEEEAKQIDESVTFDDIWFDLKDQRNIYDRLRNHYVVREVFEKIASIYGVEYDFVEKMYKRESYAKGGYMADGGKTEQLYSSIKRDRLRALEDEISTLNLMLKKLENENNEESYQESQNLREYKTILEVKKLNLEDIGYDKGGMMADGGKVDKRILEKVYEYYDIYKDGTNREHYYDFDNIEKVKEHIEKRTGMEVLKIKEIEIGRNYPDNMSHPYYHDDYEFELVKGQPLRVERMYGRPNYSGNVAYTNTIEVKNLWQMADGGMLDDEGNLIDIKIGDEVVEYKKRTPNATEKTPIGPKGRVIKIMDNFAKVSFPNDYEENILLRDLKKMSKGGMMADGGYIESGEKLYEIANNMSDKEFQEAYRNLSEKEKDLYDTLLRLGDEDKIALVTVLNESKKPKYDKSTWDLHRYAKGGLVEEIKMFDKYNYPIPKTKGDKVRAIFEHFKKKGYSTEEINTALSEINYAKGGEMADGGETESEPSGINESVYFEVYDGNRNNGIIKFHKSGSRIFETLLIGNVKAGNRKYMSYFTKNDLKSSLYRDFDVVNEVDEDYVQDRLISYEKSKPADILVVKYPYPELAKTADTLTIIKGGEQVFDYDSITKDFSLVSIGLSYPDQIELDDFLEDSKGVSESQYTPELIKVIEVIKENEDINEIVDGLKSKGLIKNYMMAEGGEVDFSERMAKMRSAYENLQMSVKGKIASAIGIDEAVAIMDTDYSIHPFNLIFGAVRGGLLELDEINKDLVNEAVDEAERVTDDYRDSGQGIGGSDMTYFTQNVLNSAGYKTGFINNTLKRVDADGNELVIDKYEMKF